MGFLPFHVYLSRVEDAAVRHTAVLLTTEPEGEVLVPAPLIVDPVPVKLCLFWSALSGMNKQTLASGAKIGACYTAVRV